MRPGSRRAPRTRGRRRRRRTPWAGLLLLLGRLGWRLLAAPAPTRAAQRMPQPHEAFGGRPLRPRVGRLVVLPAGYGVRGVLLGDHAVREVVRIAVAPSVLDLFRARIVRVTQVRWHRSGQPRPDVSHRGADGADDRVRLR